MSRPDKKLMGAAATDENKRRYAEEITKMKALGEKFPVNQHGKVSVGAFAARCGFSRFVITDGAIAEQFSADVADIGLATPEDVARFRRKTDEKQNIANDLQKQLNVKINEVEVLRKQVENLTKQVRELYLGLTEKDRTLEHMLATGERFFL